MNSNYLKRVGMSSDLKQVCYRQRLRYGALARIILLKLSVRVEISSVESNERTAATVSCDVAPPPQRRRRRHPPPPPPRNFPFVTFQGSKETYLSLHNHDVIRLTRSKWAVWTVDDVARLIEV